MYLYLRLICMSSRKNITNTKLCSAMYYMGQDRVEYLYVISYRVCKNYTKIKLNITIDSSHHKAAR